MQKILIIVAVIICSVACNKKEVDATGFTVTTDRESYTTADTVRFAFTGNPWYLTFYSGEPYHQYEYRDRVTADGVPKLSFTSTIATGSQTNTLKLLVSTDFSGVYDSTNVYNATWTDLTSKAVLAGGTDTKSGDIDLSSFLNGDKPVFIAFKYTGTAGTAQRTWTIKSLAVDNNVLIDGTSHEVLGIGESTLGFKSVAMKVATIAWTISTSQLQIKGFTTSANSVADTEGWVVSKPINLRKVLPDTGTPLKNMTTSMSSLNYIYGTAGTYKATFVSANINRYSEKGEVQEIPITVQ